MMLYPAMGELSAQIHNRYMLVNVVARRARQIAEAYENAHQILNDKPVTMAINEVADGILEDPEQVHETVEAETGTEPETDTGTETETEEPADAVEPEAGTETDSEAVEPEPEPEPETPGEAEAEEPDAE